MPLGRIPVETHIFEGNESGFEEVYSVIQTIIQDFAFDFENINSILTYHLSIVR